jgi:orotate phosphoribosyltransferase
MSDGEALFREAGALLDGHFQLSSGLHSPRYMQCALVLENPARAERLGRELAARLPACDTVVSPALGGVIIGHEVARAAGARFLFTERDAAGHAVLRRGFALLPGERVVVVEDVVTTGLSTREVIAVVQDGGASVQAVGAIVDRSGGAAGFGVPFAALMTMDIPTYQPGDCPLCRAGQPLTKPGSRKR